MTGRAELADDPRYQGDQARGDRRDELCGLMASWCADKTKAEALAALEAAGVPSGPVLTMQEALDNPQADAMGFFRNVLFPGAPMAPAVDLPVDFSDMEAGVRGRPPLLGEHTQDVLRKAGYSDEELLALQDKGVI